MDLPVEGAARLRLVHLSDLHIAAETALLRRLLRQVAAERPELIVVSGDLVDEAPEPAAMARHVRATAATMAALRRTAPVFAVQGHSEYHGALVAAVADAGAVWLANEGRTVAGPQPGEENGGLVLLGVSQQVGEDWGFRAPRSPFAPLPYRGGRLYGAKTGRDTRNDYSHYDPAPAGGLADAGGPLAWSGYDAVCDVRIERRETGAGLAVHSRYPLGEDRMIRLRRAEPVRGMPGSFALVSHGTAFTAGQVDTGVEPEPGRWYRMRVKTAVEPGAVRVWAKVWPADEPEPRAWQAWAEDRSRHRVAAGTVGLWSWGGGTVLYRDLRVTDGGRPLLAAPLAGPRPPLDWRTGARGTRLAMALARAPRRPEGGAVGVLSHSPDVALEAARRGLDFVLAGHTHGGQVRLPFHGALITRARLGAYYDSGRFAFEGPSRRGWTWLYINPGFGTSILPIRFWCPPRWAVATVR